MALEKKMAVPSTVADLDPVAANNSPLGSEPIGTNLDDYLRSHAAIIKQVSNAKLDNTNPSYTGTLTGGTGVINIGSGQLVKDASGNVGIGTSSPGKKLHIAAQENGVLISATAAGATQLYIAGNGNTAGTTSFDLAQAGDNKAYVLQRANSDLIFGTNNTERARIDASGNLLVGTTSSDGRVTVVGPNGSTCLSLINNSSGGAGGQIHQLNTSGNGRKYLRVTSADDWEIVNSAYSAVIFQVKNSGQTYNSTGTYGTISDVRLKENISDARGYLNDLCKLRVVKYSLKSEEAPQATKLGFVAQEVEQVFPGMVETSKDQLSGLDDMKQLKLSVLTPILVKAIQEQQAIIEQLKADVAALKGAA